jgi:hypothetical protein
MEEEFKLTTHHFERTSPIPQQDRRTNFCWKDHQRKFYIICKRLGCGHFRPDRVPGCDFMPQQGKDLKAYLKKKEEKKKSKKEEKAREDKMEGYSLQDHLEEEERV